MSLFPHFLCIFEISVGGQSYAGRDLVNGQDDLRTRQYLAYSMQVVLGIPKSPRFLVSKIYPPKNADSDAMVHVSRCQKVPLFHKR